MKQRGVDPLKLDVRANAPEASVQSFGGLHGMTVAFNVDPPDE